MSNISYVSALSKNMKTLSYDTSKINSLNVPYNDFMSNSHNINDLSVLKLNNGNSVFGGNLSIPKSDSFVSQLNSNMKMATLAGTAMLGAVSGSVVNGNVNLNGQTGVSLGLLALFSIIKGGWLLTALVFLFVSLAAKEYVTILKHKGFLQKLG